MAESKSKNSAALKQRISTPLIHIMGEKPTSFQAPINSEKFENRTDNDFGDDAVPVNPQWNGEDYRKSHHKKIMSMVAWVSVILVIVFLLIPIVCIINRRRKNMLQREENEKMKNLEPVEPKTASSRNMMRRTAFSEY